MPANERRVGFVFQDLALWPHLSAFDNVGFAANSAGQPATERTSRINEILSLCRVEPLLADRYPHQLSGGEQQRVALARALVVAFLAAMGFLVFLLQRIFPGGQGVQLAPLAVTFLVAVFGYRYLRRESQRLFRLWVDRQDRSVRASRVGLWTGVA